MKDYEKEAVQSAADALAGHIYLPPGQLQHLARVVFEDDPLRRLLGPEAVKQLLEGKAAVVPVREGKYFHYRERDEFGEPRTVDYSLDGIRLEMPSEGDS
jgi:hypothetical protein